jgi:hypothetical protein
MLMAMGQRAVLLRQARSYSGDHLVRSSVTRIATSIKRPMTR